MALDFGSFVGLLIKAIPEAEVATVVDDFVDAEIAKGGTEIHALVKTLLDKAYGTTIATATPAEKPLSTSVGG